MPTKPSVISGLGAGLQVVVSRYLYTGGYGIFVVPLDPPSVINGTVLLGRRLNIGEYSWSEFRIRNFGESDVVVSSSPVIFLENLEGPHFTAKELSDDLVLPPNALPEYIFRVLFNTLPPVRIKRAVLVIESNDPNYPTFEFNVAARAAEIELIST